MFTRDIDCVECEFMFVALVLVYLSNLNHPQNLQYIKSIKHWPLVVSHSYLIDG